MIRREQNLNNASPAALCGILSSSWEKDRLTACAALDVTLSGTTPALDLFKKRTFYGWAPAHGPTLNFKQITTLFMLRTSMLTIAVLLVTLMAAPAQAQQATPQQQPQELPDIEVDDQELRSIANAYVAVQNVTATYRDQLNNAEDAEAARAIQQEYAQVANQAIEGEGVSIERYDTVIQVARADEDLGERLLTEIQVVMEEQAGPGNPDS